MTQIRAEQKPVLLMTRPRAASVRFWDQLGPQLQGRVNLCLSPLITIEPKAADIDLTGVTGVIFTSSNAVTLADVPTDLPAYCVGERTTEAAQTRGHNAQMCGPTADALVETLLKTPTNGVLLHLHGTHTRGDVAARLREGGCETRTATIYDQHHMPLSAKARTHLVDPIPVIAPVFSPRTAALLADEMGPQNHICVVAISEAAAEPFAKVKTANVVISPCPDATGMAECVKETVERLRADTRGNP